MHIKNEEKKIYRVNFLSFLPQQLFGRQNLGGIFIQEKKKSF